MSIKIYGQKRTGTNLIEYLLKQAGATVMVNTGGWKHGPARRVGDRQIIIGKTCANWTASYERYVCPPKEEDWGPDEWERHEYQYLHFALTNKTALYVPYEHFMDSPKLWWSVIVKHCDLKAELPEMPRNYMGRNGMPTGYKFTPDTSVPGIHKKEN